MKVSSTSTVYFNGVHLGGGCIKINSITRHCKIKRSKRDTRLKENSTCQINKCRKDMRVLVTMEDESEHAHLHISMRINDLVFCPGRPAGQPPTARGDRRHPASPRGVTTVERNSLSCVQP